MKETKKNGVIWFILFILQKIYHINLFEIYYKILNNKVDIVLYFIYFAL